MNSTTVLLLIAIGIVITVLLIVPSGENFEYGSYVPYQPSMADLLTAESSVDCSKTPEAPACQPLPPVDPVGKELATCAPADGQWSTPGTGAQGRSTLNSPCCQPPDYKVAKNYKTCDDQLDPNNPLDKCIAECCANAATEANSYDTSWYPMARCACSLWCHNKDVPHFKKYGTAVHYITGDLGEAKTSDSGDFIGGGSGYDFSGQ